MKAYLTRATIPIVKTNIYLIRIVPVRNIYRQYEVIPIHTEHEGYKIEYRWGRIGGYVRGLIKHYSNKRQWQLALQRAIRRRYKHGYLLLGVEGDTTSILATKPIIDSQDLKTYTGRVGLQTQLF